jgi:hypothetical protein
MQTVGKNLTTNGTNRRNERGAMAIRVIRGCFWLELFESQIPAEGKRAINAKF